MQLPTFTLDAPPDGAPPSRSKSPGPEHHRRAAEAPRPKGVLHDTTNGVGPTTQNAVTYGMSIKSVHEEVVPPSPISSMGSSPALSSAASPTPAMPQQPETLANQSQVLATTSHVSIAGQDPYPAAAAAHHAQLVAYYWHYAQMGLVAPVVEGDEAQLRARTEAVEWARGLGLQVQDLGGHFGSAPVTPAQQAFAVAHTPAPINPQAQVILLPTPHRVAQPSCTSVTPAPLGSSFPHQVRAQHAPVKVTDSPAPQSPISNRPLPSIPPVAPQRRPLPSPSPHAAAQSTVRRSTSLELASPAAPSSSRLGRSPSSPTTRAPSLPVASSAASSSAGGRPLPMPPPVAATRSATQPLPTVADVDSLSNGVAAVSLASASAPTIVADQVPSIAVGSRPASPAFAFTLVEEPVADAGVPSIAAPSFSFGDESPPVSLPAPPVAAAPRLHPRHDPSHPSHYLYHPTSTPSRLEAGAIACAGCGQQMFGRALMAMGREWHPGCFRCSEEGCGLLLEMIQFDGREEEVETDDNDTSQEPRTELRVYCMVHFEEHYAEQCYHCKTPIADSEYIRLRDPLLLPPLPLRTYHALHFFCSNCGDPFVDPSSLAKGKEGTLAKPYIVHKGYAYCEACDLRMFKPKCASSRCGKSGIPGDWVEASGLKYHEDCFRCGTCDNLLSGSYLMRDDGPDAGGEKIYCVGCYDIRAKEEANAARERRVYG